MSSSLITRTGSAEPDMPSTSQGQVGLPDIVLPQPGTFSYVDGVPVVHPFMSPPVVTTPPNVLPKQLKSCLSNKSTHKVEKRVSFSYPLTFMEGTPFITPNNMQPGSASAFLIPVALTEQAASSLIDPVLNQMLDSRKRSFVRFVDCKKVNNSELEHQFCRKQSAFAHDSIPTEVSYAFLALPNGDSGEVDNLCQYGIRTGLSFGGELADSTKGVYLSKYADTVNPSCSLTNQNFQIIVCKVLKGRFLTVTPQTGPTGSKRKPERHYHSFQAVEPHFKLVDQQPHIRYRYSQLYVYEYDQSAGSFVDRPATILPISVVTFSIQMPGPDYLDKVGFECPGVWTGTMDIQKQVMKHVTLYSLFNYTNRPKCLDNIKCDLVVSYDDIMGFGPLRNLLEDNKIGLLLKLSEIRVRDNNQTIFVQYFIAKCAHVQFENMCNFMMRESVVAASVLLNGTKLIMIPNGGLSQKLGLFLYEFPVFHCLFFAGHSAEFCNSNNPLPKKLPRENTTSVIDMNNPIVRSKIPHLESPTTAPAEPTERIPTNQNANGFQPITESTTLTPIVPTTAPLNGSTPPLTKPATPVAPSGATPAHRVAPILPPLPRIPMDEGEAKVTEEADDMLARLEHGDRSEILKDPRMEMLRKRDPVKFKELIQEKIRELELAKASQPKASEDTKPSSRASSPMDSSMLVIAEPESEPEPVAPSTEKQTTVTPVCPIVPPKASPPRPKVQQPTEDIDLRVFSPSGDPCPSATHAPLGKLNPLAENVDLIIDPDFVVNGIKVTDLNKLLDAATCMNKLSTKRVSILWHACINELLEQQKNDARSKLNCERAKSLLMLYNNYKIAGLICVMKHHTCDMSARNANKYLICGMIHKSKNQSSRLVFVSDSIDPNVGVGRNFATNNLELYTIDAIFKQWHTT